jgi:hypothetical protein
MAGWDSDSNGKFRKSMFGVQQIYFFANGLYAIGRRDRFHKARITCPLVAMMTTGPKGIILHDELPRMTRPQVGSIADSMTR